MLRKVESTIAKLEAKLTTPGDTTGAASGDSAETAVSDAEAAIAEIDSLEAGLRRFDASLNTEC